MKRAVLSTILTVVFLALLLRQVDFAHAAAALTVTDYGLLFLAVPFYFAGVWFRTLRWQQLLTPLATLQTPGLFRQVVIGYMANDVLPFRAGEVVRAYLLGRQHHLSKAAVLGTIALERLTDGLTLLAFAGVIALFIPLDGWMAPVVRTMALVFVGAAAGAWVLLLAKERLLARLPPSAFRLAVSAFLGGTESLRRPRLLSRVAMYAVLSWLFEGGVFYVVAVAMGISQPAWLYLLAMALANLGTALPSSQAGIGPFEYFGAQTLVLFGTDPSIAASYALLVHAVLILPVTLLGFFYLWRDHLSLGRITEEARAAPHSSYLVPRP